MYVVYTNLLYFLSIFSFTYNQNLISPPPKNKKIANSNYLHFQIYLLIKLSNFIHLITWWLHGSEDPLYS